MREADGRYREVTESRAFPGWTTAEIHAALSAKVLPEETYGVLERVGRRMGALEGTGPDDSPLLRSMRDEARDQARAAALAETVRSVLRIRGIGMSAELARDMAAWSDMPHETLVSAAMSCEDEADFRGRVRNMRALEGGGGVKAPLHP